MRGRRRGGAHRVQEPCEHQLRRPVRGSNASARGLDWLRLRWLSILLVLIPIVVVTGSLWGAGDAPKHFQDIGVALLAGYSSDSLFRNSIARLSSAKS